MKTTCASECCECCACVAVPLQYVPCQILQYVYASCSKPCLKEEYKTYGKEAACCRLCCYLKTPVNECDAWCSNKCLDYTLLAHNGLLMCLANVYNSQKDIPKVERPADYSLCCDLGCTYSILAYRAKHGFQYAKHPANNNTQFNWRMCGVNTCCICAAPVLIPCALGASAATVVAYFALAPLYYVVSTIEALAAGSCSCCLEMTKCCLPSTWYDSCRAAQKPWMDRVFRTDFENQHKEDNDYSGNNECYSCSSMCGCCRYCHEDPKCEWSLPCQMEMSKLPAPSLYYDPTVTDWLGNPRQSMK